MMPSNMRLYMGSIFLLCYTQMVFAGKHGVIGIGIDTHKLVCCCACHDSLSSPYLNCTKFSMESDDGMSMKMMGSTSDSCYASNLPWLETLGYCIRSSCSEDGIAYWRQSKYFHDLSIKRYQSRRCAAFSPTHLRASGGCRMAQLDHAC